MSSGFKPLVPSSAPTPGLSGRVAAAGEAAGKFSPLVKGGGVPAPKSSAPAIVQKQTPATGSAASAALRSLPSSGEPAVPCSTPAVTNVIKQGDRITHIEVRCGCGEVITIECAY